MAVDLDGTAGRILLVGVVISVALFASLYPATRRVLVLQGVHGTDRKES